MEQKNCNNSSAFSFSGISFIKMGKRIPSFFKEYNEKVLSEQKIMKSIKSTKIKSIALYLREREKGWKR